jgi:phosphoglycolate phosphatase
MSIRPGAADTLLIDLDGTLIDTVDDFVAALRTLAPELGETAPAPDRVRAAIGRGGERLMKDLFPAQAEQAYARWPTHYAAANGRHARPFDGAREVLAELSAQGWRLACVTNKPQALAEQLLADWRALLPVIVGARPALRPKPHPDALLTAAASMARAPQCCWMVGDSANDAQAAQAAGCAGTLLFSHGYNHGEPIEQVPADAHMAHWRDLPASLARLAGRRT